jgi:hypothetical protein
MGNVSDLLFASSVWWGTRHPIFLPSPRKLTIDHLRRDLIASLIMHSCVTGSSVEHLVRDGKGGACPGPVHDAKIVLVVLDWQNRDCNDNRR